MNQGVHMGEIDFSLAEENTFVPSMPKAHDSLQQSLRKSRLKKFRY